MLKPRPLLTAFINFIILIGSIGSLHNWYTNPVGLMILLYWSPLFLLIFSITGLVGSSLIMCKEYQIGGILTLISGIITIPTIIGIYSIITGKRALAFLKVQKLEEERKRFEAEQEAKGFVKFVDRHGREKWGTPEQIKHWKRVDIGLGSDFKDLTPREFEKLIVELFAKMGYKVRLTPYVADYGGDLVAKKCGETVVVQVKKWKTGHNVGARDIQQALGAMWKYGANKTIFITTSDFTVHAKEQAKGAPIELWNKHRLYELIEKYLITDFSVCKEEEIIKEQILLLNDAKKVVERLGYEEIFNEIQIKEEGKTKLYGFGATIKSFPKDNLEVLCYFDHKLPNPTLKKVHFIFNVHQSNPDKPYSTERMDKIYEKFKPKWLKATKELSENWKSNRRNNILTIFL